MTGEVIKFHARASTTDLKPKTAGSASISRLASASESARKFSDGIVPRAFQLLTADGPTPVSVATAEVPPRALMTASAEQSIPQDNSRNMKLSTLHPTEMDFSRRVRPNWPMADSREKIMRRLRLLPEILGKNKTEIAQDIGINSSQWSNYISATASKNVIPWEVSTELKLCYRLTLDWIYCGDVASITDEALRIRIRRAERQLEENDRVEVGAKAKNA